VALVVVAQVVTLTAALLGGTSPVSMAVSFCTTTNCAKFNPMPYVMAAAWRRKEVGKGEAKPAHGCSNLHHRRTAFGVPPEV
jgi:hypothetical protein